MPMKYTTAFFTCSGSLCRRPMIAPAWAMASIVRTPGITGAAGKCPAKKGSLMDTFLIATSRLSASTSITRSINRKGNRCGSIRMISAMRSSIECLLFGRSRSCWFTRRRSRCSRCGLWVFGVFRIHTPNDFIGYVGARAEMDDIVRICCWIQHYGKTIFDGISIERLVHQNCNRRQKLVLKILGFLLCVFLSTLPFLLLGVQLPCQFIFFCIGLGRPQFFLQLRCLFAQFFQNGCLRRQFLGVFGTGDAARLTLRDRLAHVNQRNFCTGYRRRGRLRGSRRCRRLGRGLGQSRGRQTDRK